VPELGEGSFQEVRACFFEPAAGGLSGGAFSFGLDFQCRRDVTGEGTAQWAAAVGVATGTARGSTSSVQIVPSAAPDPSIWDVSVDPTDLLRRQFEAIPAVKSFIVGADLGGDYEVGAIFVLENLDGFWEYLVHPVHFESEKWGFPFVERFEAFDTTDSDDPDYGQKIAALQTRSYQENPELAALVSQVASFEAAGDSGSPE